MRRPQECATFPIVTGPCNLQQLYLHLDGANWHLAGWKTLPVGFCGPWPCSLSVSRWMFIAGVCFPGRSAPSPGAALLPAARILPGLWRNQNLRSLLRCPDSGPQGVRRDVRLYIFISFFKKHLFLLEGIERCRKAAAIGTRSCVSLTISADGHLRLQQGPSLSAGNELCSSFGFH